MCPCSESLQLFDQYELSQRGCALTSELILIALPVDMKMDDL